MRKAYRHPKAPKEAGLRGEVFANLHSAVSSAAGPEHAAPLDLARFGHVKVARHVAQ